LYRARAEETGLKRIQDVIQFVNKGGEVTPRSALEILSTLLNSKSYSIEDEDIGKILGVININNLEMLKNEAQKVRNLSKQANLTHYVLHISAENALKLEYQELLQVFIDRGAKVWIHTNSDKGQNSENVERIFYLGVFSAWLGEQFEEFELKNETARMGYPKGYFSVAAYFADPLFQTILNEAIAQQHVAVAA
jgi:nitrate reductase NapAB chaperone NapD